MHIDTVNGIVTVHNASDPVWPHEDSWWIEEAFRIGSLDGPQEELFSGPLMAVSLGPQGSIYILDHQAGDIRVFDGLGRFRFSFGGPGVGPGELNKPTSLGWDKLDRLWVPNAFDGRYTVFDSLGSLVKIKTIPTGRGLHRLIYPLHFDGRGTFVDQSANLERLRLVRRDTAAELLDSLAVLQFPGASPGPPILSHTISPKTREALRHLRPRLVWALAPDGTIWEARTDQLRLIQRTMEGDTLRVITTKHRVPVFTDSEKDAMRRAKRELGRDLVFGAPVLRMIYVMDDGHIFAHIAGEFGQPTDTMDVFGPSGRFLGSMRWPFIPDRRAVHAFHGDTIVAATLDSLDVPYVVRATIERNNK